MAGSYDSQEFGGRFEARYRSYTIQLCKYRTQNTASLPSPAVFPTMATSSRRACTAVALGGFPAATTTRAFGRVQLPFHALTMLQTGH